MLCSCICCELKLPPPPHLSPTIRSLLLCLWHAYKICKQSKTLMCMHTRMHTHTCTHTHTCAHTHTHTRAHTHTHTHTHSLKYMHILYTFDQRKKEKHKTCPVNSSKTDSSFYIPAMKGVHICICECNSVCVCVCVHAHGWLTSITIIEHNTFIAISVTSVAFPGKSTDTKMEQNVLLTSFYPIELNVCDICHMIWTWSLNIWIR